MSTAADSSKNENESTYVINAEDAAEMARLLDQDKLINEDMGGLFPERTDLSNIYDVLDIACGPGGWVHEVAHSYPEVEVTGFDISKRMIEYARAHAQVRKLDNAHFRVMDALKPLDFPNESFDLVNARTIFAFMPPKAWPGLLQEGMRILRPGGTIRLTEFEAGFSNMPAFERYCWLVNQAMQRVGLSFSPNGLHTSIVVMLRRFLRDAGCQHIRQVAHVIDYSAGTDANKGSYQDSLRGFKLVQPLLLKTGVTTQDEADRLYEQTMVEMQSEDFCSLGFILTAWGQKPMA